MANTQQQDPLDILGDLFTSGGDQDPDDSSSMTLIEHLEELRWRIFKSLIAIVLFAIVAFIFREPILNFLTWPLPKTANAFTALPGHKSQSLVVGGVGEGFTTYLLVSAAVGFLAALPVILYQVWAFVAPGLYAHEKRYALPFIIVGSILFVAGLALGYVVLQYPVSWLINFASDNFTELVSAGNYFTFVAYFLLAFGIVFEIPLVLTFLSLVGVITAETLTRKRAAAHVGMWIAATVLTPGADFYSPIILGITMSCLFELSVLFIKITARMRARSESAA
jgi:sec-independent protein translocase protein TatC